MTIKPGRPCKSPCCPNVTSDKSGYCDQHRGLQNKEHNETSNAVYNSHWRKIRAAKLNVNPLCELCQQQGRVEVATDVHHLDGNPENMSDNNLQSLCHSCHSKITVRQLKVY